MKKLLLIALTTIMMAGCAGRIGKRTDRLINDGHDYLRIVFYDRAYIVHSPECDSCKAIRRAEIRELLREIEHGNQDKQ